MLLCPASPMEQQIGARCEKTFLGSYRKSKPLSNCHKHSIAPTHIYSFKESDSLRQLQFRERKELWRRPCQNTYLITRKMKSKRCRIIHQIRIENDVWAATGSAARKVIDRDGVVTTPSENKMVGYFSLTTPNLHCYTYSPSSVEAALCSAKTAWDADGFTRSILTSIRT